MLSAQMHWDVNFQPMIDYLAVDHYPTEMNRPSVVAKQKMVLKKNWNSRRKKWSIPSMHLTVPSNNLHLVCHCLLVRIDFPTRFCSFDYHRLLFQLPVPIRPSHLQCIFWIEEWHLARTDRCQHRDSWSARTKKQFKYKTLTFQRIPLSTHLEFMQFFQTITSSLLIRYQCENRLHRFVRLQWHSFIAW